MKIDLSIRMKMNASLADDNSRVADIGCDHGYVAMWLAQNKNCKYVIASDVNDGPIRRAEKNIKAAGLDDRITVRKGYGLSVLEPGEVDTCIIAGMGGMLICEILSNATDILETINKLILQPQSDVEAVRRHIHKLGFRITDEKICMDGGKYYISIVAVPGSEETPYTDNEYRFSRILANEGGSIFRSYVKSIIDKLSKLVEELDSEELSASERVIGRKEEILNNLEEIKKRL